MKRRDFIQKSAAGLALASLSSYNLVSCTSNTKQHITILHTNDTHSHLDHFPPGHPEFPNQGGVARRAVLVDTIRKENPNTLLLDAGDIFQGTPYFNYYGGELEFKIMSMMRYDAATLGNHDFDNGLNGLASQMPYANFDFVCANYAFVNTPLSDRVKPYKIFVRDKIKIGVFGLGIELKGLVDKKNYEETVYLDPIEIAQDITKELKEQQQCDLIICLSHLGYHYIDNPTKVSDRILAEKTENIDLIIGGHTHTFLDKPVIVTNKAGKEVLINQVGCYGINLGRIDFFFDEASKVNQTQGVSIAV